MTTIKQSITAVLCGGLCIATVTPTVVAAPSSPHQTKTATAKKAAPAHVVQGTIKAIAKTPRPGSVPYKDAVTAIHLTKVKSVQGKPTRSSIVVYVWGMRNNKLAPAASYRAGQTVKLTLQPWDKVEGKYGRYQRMELDDEGTLALDAFWGEVK